MRHAKAVVAAAVGWLLVGGHALAQPPDPKSYFVDGERIVFARSLGVRKNAVVLPPGYELVACNVPAQVLQEPDGRVQASFMNPGPDAATLVVKGRRLP
jgi:hypothetical protein